MKRKTIFFIGLSWPPTTFIARKLKVLAESGKFNIIVGISSPYKRTDFSFKIPGIKLIKLSHTEDPILIRLFYLIRYSILLFFRSPKKYYRILALAHSESRNIKVFFNKLLNFLAIVSQNFDIAHFEWISCASDYLTLLNSLKKSYSVSARGSQITIDPLLDNKYRERLQEILKHAKAVHCVSKAMAEETKKIYKDRNTVVIYNGIDLNIFKCNPEKKSSELNIVFIGSLIWKKAVDLAIYIFFKYLKMGGEGRMFIIGDGEEKQKMCFTINDLNLADKIAYLGKKREQEVAQILKDMDVLLLPSFAEGLANVILEAMATCTVPVASDVQGNSEAIIHGETGFLFPLLDFKKPAEYLYYLYSHPEKLQEMKKNARKSVEKSFTLQQMREGHLKFYERLLS